MKNKTNFNIFLEEQLQDPEFKKRFEQAGEAWEVAFQLAALRKARGNNCTSFSVILPGVSVNLTA